GGASLKGASATMLLEMFSLRGERGLFLWIHARGVPAIAQAELIVKDEGNAGADAFPLFFKRSCRFVFDPGLKVFGRKVFKIVGAAAKLALMMPAVIKIE